MRWGAVMLTGAVLAWSGPAWAEFDCAKAWLPVDHVICASPGLMKTNDDLGVAWAALRDRLGEAEGAQALAEQRQWIKEYPVRCGLPAKGKPPAAAIKAAVPCIDKALRGRTEDLRSRLAALAPAVAVAEGDWRLTTTPAAAGVQLRLGGGAGLQATFVVHGPDGRRWTYHTALTGGAAEALFPDDFRAPTAPGAYRVETLIDHRAATAGDFVVR